MRAVLSVISDVEKLPLYLQNPNYQFSLMNQLRPEDASDAMIRIISGPSLPVA